MNIQVNVINQKLKIATNIKSLVAGTQEFIRFEFFFDEDWENLKVFAQFRQKNTAYNVYLDENNAVYLPSEIQPGDCEITLYGSRDAVIAVTGTLHMTIDDNRMIVDTESTGITTSLYEQLIQTISNVVAGAHFTPSVSEDGIISWTNDAGLVNPDPINIMGKPGKDGVGVVSIEQTTVSNSDNGENVVSVHLSNDVSSTFTVKNGSKGSKGDTGVGIASVKQTTTSDADGGINVISMGLTDGSTSTFSIKNGSKGSKGADGVGIDSIEQTTTSNADDGINLVSVKLTDGTSSSFSVKNGSRGSSGKDGVGIVSIEQTVSSDEDNGNNIVNVKLTDGTLSTFTVKNGSKGLTGEDGVGIESIEQTIVSDVDGGVNIITVTLTNGETSRFTIKNGSDGSDASYVVDDTLTIPGLAADSYAVGEKLKELSDSVDDRVSSVSINAEDDGAGNVTLSLIYK